jgi:hypothetical protein
MEQQKPISNVTAGLVIGGLLVVLSLVSYYLNNNAASAVQWLTYLVIIGGLIVFINLYAKAHDYSFSFGNLFAYGFRTTAVYTLVVIAFVVIFNMIFPAMKEKGFDLARQKLEQDGKLTDDQIDSAIQMTRKYFWVFAIGGTLLANIIMGAIGSLIGAAVTKKRPNNPLEQLNV